MPAICYEHGQPLVVEDIALDAPQRGEVRVRVGAVAICHSDVHLIRGSGAARCPWWPVTKRPGSWRQSETTLVW